MLLTELGSAAKTPAALLELSRDSQQSKLLAKVAEKKDAADGPSEDEWSKYRLLSVLGEGSYGKVFKVAQAPA